MLVLSRKIGETIRVGSDLELVVLSVNRGRVKLGFAGSRDVPIRRGEFTADSLIPTNSHLPTGSPIVTEQACCGVTAGSTGPALAPLRAYRMPSGV